MRCFAKRNLSQATAAYTGTAGAAVLAAAAPRAVPSVPALQRLEGVGNARDFAEACSKIAPGKMFRSANPIGATRTDVEILRQQLGICELIDLRSRLERREDQPGLLLQDAIVRDVRQQGRLFRTHASFKKRTQWISDLSRRPASPPDSDASPSEHSAQHSGDSDASSSNGNEAAAMSSPTSPPLILHQVSLIESVPYITELAKRLPPGSKRRLLFSVASKRRRKAALENVFTAVNDGGLVMLNQILLESAAPQIRAALRIMTTAAENDRPLLTYCRLGKDRTGLMTALVLSTCGATQSEIISDYIRTQSHSDQIALGGLEKKTIFQGIDKGHFSSALPETMDAVLTHISSKYGSTLKYLEHIGFGPDDQARLQRSLLEG